MDEPSIETSGVGQNDISVYIYSLVPAAVILTVLVIVLIMITVVYRWRIRKHNIVIRWVHFHVFKYTVINLISSLPMCIVN